MNLTMTGDIVGPSDFTRLINALNHEFQKRLNAVATVAQQTIRARALSQKGTQTLGIVTGTLKGSLIAAAQQSGAYGSWGNVRVHVEPNVNPKNSKTADFYGGIHEKGKGWLTYGLTLAEPLVVQQAESEIKGAIQQIF